MKWLRARPFRAPERAGFDPAGANVLACPLVGYMHVPTVTSVRAAGSGRSSSGVAGSVQRGVWVDPAKQQVGNIAELDPGAYAFGRW